MRTLGFVLLPLVIAGGVFAQDQPPSQGQFFQPPMQKPPEATPLWRPLPVFSFAAPGVPLPPVPSAIPSQCAVPLIEMKTPAATDSIARTPASPAIADPIAVPPPVLSCSDVPSSAYNSNAEGLKHLKEARDRLQQFKEQQQGLKEAQPAAPPADAVPAPK